jgi:hypothetical protein
MRIAGLTQDLEQSRIGHEEKSGEDQTFFLQIAGQRLLTDFELLQKMWQQLTQSVIAHTALHNVGSLVSALHDLLPRFVDIAESFGFLQFRKIFKLKNKN